MEIVLHGRLGVLVTRFSETILLLKVLAAATLGKRDEAKKISRETSRELSAF